MEKQPQNIQDGFLNSARKEKTLEGGKGFVITEPGNRTIIKEHNRFVIQHDERERLMKVAPNARFEKGKRIAWNTVGGDVETTGQVTFNDLPQAETEVTAVFCDISDYTALAAEMTPRQALELLNRYFPVVADHVFQNGGTLEEYIGALQRRYRASSGRPVPEDPFAEDRRPTFAIAEDGA